MKTKDTINDFKMAFKRTSYLMVIALFCICVCSGMLIIHVQNFSSNYGYNMGIAQALLEGSVPYKDVFTNLGPIALLVYSLFSMVKAFNIVLMFQVVSGIVFILIINRIMRKFVGVHSSIVATMLIAVLTYTSSSYALGGTMEEFLLPLFAYLLLCLIEYVLEGKQFSALRITCVSIAVALIVWTKFNLIVFPILFIITYIALSIRNKQYKTIMLHLLSFVFVFITVSMLMIWYLYINKCLVEFASCYFTFAINIPVALNNLLNNLILLLMAAFGIVYVIAKKKECLLEIAIMLSAFILSMVFTASELVNVLPLAVVGSLGSAFLLEIVENSNMLKKTKNVTKIFMCILLVVYTFIFSNAMWNSNNSVVYEGQTKILETIAKQEVENPTLLCYKLDNYGLYNNTGVKIGTEIFANNGIVENINEERIKFDQSLLNKDTIFVLMEQSAYNANKKSISENYTQLGSYTITTIDNCITTEIDVVLLMIK